MTKHFLNTCTSMQTIIIVAGSGVYITGWGAYGFNGPTSKVLLQGLIQVTTNEECKEKFSQFKNGKNFELLSVYLSINESFDLFNIDSFLQLTSEIPRSVPE